MSSRLSRPIQAHFLPNFDYPTSLHEDRISLGHMAEIYKMALLPILDISPSDLSFCCEAWQLVQETSVSGPT